MVHENTKGKKELQEGLCPRLPLSRKTLNQAVQGGDPRSELGFLHCRHAHITVQVPPKFVK